MSTVGGDRLGDPGTQVGAAKGKKDKKGKKAPAPPKGISSRSWIVSDAETGDVLGAHNAHWKLPPASTLKMLFADSVLPKLPKTKRHTVKRSDLKGMGEGSSLVGVKEGSSYSVRDLWRGVFLRSGNDAVHVLAAMNGGVDKTVDEMNENARKLRAGDTHVVTPDGYDKKGQVSSAYDLTLFARAGMQSADFRDYASTARAKFPAEEKKKGKKGKNGKNGKMGQGKRGSYQIQNTNRLLTGDVGIKPYPGIAGVKNGSTTKAGNTFTGVAQHGDRVLLVTCMHPEDEAPFEVYKEAAKLFDWGFDAAGRVRPVGKLAAPHSSGTIGGAGADKGGDDKRAGHDAKAGRADAAAKARQGAHASSGVGAALGITAGVLAVLAIVAYVVHRRWPLPDLVTFRRGR